MSVGTAGRQRQVAIVGRPNVGKSSLFNRIIGERRAIVEDEPGTTRDRLEAETEWLGRRFRLVDTGGYMTGEGDAYAPLIVEQIAAALAASDVLVFCVDARDGLTSSDYEIAEVVRKAGRPTILVATKADNERREEAGIAEASALGLGEALPVSALHDIHVGLLLDAVAALLPESEPEVVSERTRVAIIGRPNVGKSMLVNALLGEERVIVSEVPGTTRDAIDSELDSPEGAFLLVDTAGVRRPGKLGRGVERHSVMRTRAAVERCDVAVLVVDGTAGVTAQDSHIAGIAVEEAKGLVVAVNKIDLWEDEEEARHRVSRMFRGRMQYAPWVLVGYISAMERKGLDGLLALVATAAEARRRRVPTAELNSLLRRAMDSHAHPVVHSKRLKLLYATQADTDPPTFILFVNEPAIVHFSYRRYLERTIRDAYDFEGTGIRVVLRGRSDEEARP